MREMAGPLPFLWLLVVVSSGCCSDHSPQAREWLSKESYVGQDLRKLNKAASESLTRQIERLGVEPAQVWAAGPSEPRWVKPFVVDNVGGWMLLRAYPGYDVPDVSGFQVCTLDASWKPRI